MINPLILSSFILIPVVGIFFSSFIAMFLQNKKFLFIGQIIIVLFFIINLITIFYMALNYKLDSDVSRSFSTLFSMNALSLIVLLLVELVFTLVAIYSLKYIAKLKQFHYFIFYFSLNLGIILTLLANNLFVLFISWELMVISGYILVSFNRTLEAFEAGFKYLIISSIGSLFMLLGIGLLSGLVPSLNFSDIATQNVLSNELGILSLSFIVIGFATTGGVFIFNQWLPDAHPEAPAPVSALLSGIVVNLGIYGLFQTFRIYSLANEFYSTNASFVILLLGLLTMFEGSIMVFVQFSKENIDLKRILAYSTISHMGFLIAITPLSSNLGITALIYHILSHSLAKNLLFLMAGYLQLTYGTRNLNLLAGVGRKDKLTGYLFILGLFSLAGFPGTAGFISELLIFLTIASSGIVINFYLFTFITLLVIFNSILAFGGYLWLMKILVFNEPSQIVLTMNSSLKTKKIMRYTVTIFGILILFLGIFPTIIINYIDSLFI